jgi:phosphatidylserine/phosphatidylglycerophosphate/cardiolipin synthase-like enzyme
MATVAKPHDETLEISTFVLDMARKRKRLQVGGIGRVLGAGLISEMRSADGLRLGEVINIAAAGAGDAWSIGRARGRELVNLLGNLKETLPSSVDDYLKRRGTQAGTMYGRAHHDFMLNAIDDAQYSICILSGWLSKRIVDADFMEAISSAMCRGVDVYLGYGYEYQRGHEEKGDSKIALAVLRTAANDAMKASRPGSLKVGKFATHEKILLIDCSVIVSGSHNWLSNASHLNEESSLIVEDKNLAQQECVRVKKRIAENAVISSTE